MPYPLKPIFLTLILYLFCCFTSLDVQGQNDDSTSSKKIFIKAGQFLMTSKETHYYGRDTIIYLPRNEEFIIKDSSYFRQEELYKKIKTISSGYRVTKEMYAWFFRSKPLENVAPPPELIESDSQFMAYKGKIIRDIRIKKIPVFGSSIRDTSFLINESWILRTGNKVHVNTRDYIIRQTLLFAKGDRIDPMLLSDNERIIRNMSSIEDAIIMVDERYPGSDSVDIVIITRDVWSSGLYLDIHSINNFDCGIRQKNLLGYGNELSNRILINSREDALFGYKGYFRNENLYGTFTGLDISFEDYFGNELYNVKFSRPFISDQLKWGGGIEFSRKTIITDLLTIDLHPYVMPVKSDLMDIWIGRIFTLRRFATHNSITSRMVVSGRLIDRYYSQRPDVSPVGSRQYYNAKLFLGNISFTGHRFYKSNLIYGFGKTEDIPFGKLLELTAGIEKNNFYNRYYGSVQLLNGKYFRKIGYYSYKLSLGSFFKDGVVEDGIFNFQINTFTDLFYVKDYRFRIFFKLNYLLGLNRNTGDYTTINGNDGIRGFNEDRLRGFQKLVFSFETVSFMPFSFYEFKFALFAFSDIAAISGSSEKIFDKKFYSSIGIGFRIRNENLVFKTIQFRLAYYPVVPGNSKNWSGEIGSGDYLHQFDFSGNPPVILGFP